MGFLLSLFLNLFIAAILRPKVKQQEPSVKLEDLKFPTADRGRKIPVVVGRRHVLAPNAVWYEPGDVWQTGPGGAYSHYSGSIHMVIAHAPVVLYNIHVDKKTLGITEAEGRRDTTRVIGRLLLNNSVYKTIYYDAEGLQSLRLTRGGVESTIQCNAISFNVTLEGKDPKIECSMQQLSSPEVPVLIRGDGTFENDNGTTGSGTGIYTLYVLKDGDNFEVGITTRVNEHDNVGVEPDIVTVSALTYDPNLQASSAGGVIVDSFNLYLSRPNHMGGETKQGGIVGDITYLSGTSTPPLDAIDFLEDRQGGKSPHYLGVSSLLVRDCTLGANSSQVAPWGFDVGGYYNSLGVENSRAMIGEGANAACFLYECLVNTEWGKGEDPDNIDIDSFKDVANTLADEGIGCFFVWSESEAIDVIMSKVLDDIFGLWIPDPYNGGRIRISLLRAYEGSTENLPKIKPLKIVQGKSRQANQGTNQVIVTYKSHAAYEDERNTFTVTNQSALQLSEGRLVAKTIDLPTIGTSESAQKIANLHLMVESLPLTTYTVTLDQFDLEIKPGAFVFYEDPDGNSITNIHRVLDVDIKDRTTTVTLLEDMYSYSLTLAGDIAIEGTSLANPSEAVSPPFQLLKLLDGSPYPTPKLSNSTINAICLLSNYPSSLQSTTLKYTGASSIIASKPFGMSYFTSPVPVGSSWQESLFSSVQVVGEIEVVQGVTLLAYACTGEWLRIDSYDSGTQLLEVTRGVLGTVPAVIPKGTVIFIVKPDEVTYATSRDISVPWATLHGGSVDISETLKSADGSPVEGQRVLHDPEYVHSSLTKRIITPNKVLTSSGANLVNHAQVTVNSTTDLTLSYQVFIRYPFFGEHIIGASEGEVSGNVAFPTLSKQSMKANLLYTREQVRVSVRVRGSSSIYSHTLDTNDPSNAYQLSSKVTTSDIVVPSSVDKFMIDITVEYILGGSTPIEVSEPFTLSYTRSGSGNDVSVTTHLSPVQINSVEI